MTNVPIMKSILFFLICLTILHLTLSNSLNVVLNVKANTDRLGHQIDKTFLRRAKNYAENMFMRRDALTSTTVNDAETTSTVWLGDNTQSNLPDDRQHKPGNSADDAERPMYTFKKDIQSEHQDKKVAKKFRDKTKVLKKYKRIRHHNGEKYDKHLVRNDRKVRKKLRQHENPNKKIRKHSSEEPDPILNIPMGGSGHIAQEYFEIDPILNMLRSNIHTRRQSSNDSSSDSSSQELGNFREQFKAMWLGKKFEALNSTVPEGDQVNMGGARPWGVQCGDPNQHDMPWGTCMLPMECEAEYRIFRGDMYCGRTSFVCCALELTTYDMYQGFDVSFEGKSLSSDSQGEEEQRKKKHKNKKRRASRKLRKKRIKSTIRNIIKEITKILHKFYANATKQRKKKTRQLQRFIKFLKSEYKKNRNMVHDLHEEAMVKIDTQLLKKLYEIKSMNVNFMRNQTFADIVVNGTMSKRGARMLLQAYPELEEFIDKNSPPTPAIERKMVDTKTRRFGGAVPESKEKTDLIHKLDYLEYDVEYGFLYY